MVVYTTEGQDTASRMPRLLKVEDAADVLGVSKDYIYKAVNEGHLAAVYLGNGKRQHLRIKPADLDKFVETRRVA